jgi:hypothetical protein
MTHNPRSAAVAVSRRPLFGCPLGNAALLAVVALAASATLTLAVAARTAAAQAGAVIVAPTLVAVPGDYAINATPTWTFTGEPARVSVARWSSRARAPGTAKRASDEAAK